MTLTAPALVLIDWQRGFDDLAHWGEARSTPAAEDRALEMLSYWRSREWPVIHVVHHSLDPASPLHPDSAGVACKQGFVPASNEPLVTKRVNSGFIGTDLDGMLRRQDIDRLFLSGLTSNHCVSTTARMAGNLGYDVTVSADACAAFDRTGHDGKHFDAETVHALSLANLHGEFANVADTETIIGLLSST